jgi:hypothetical protein
MAATLGQDAGAVLRPLTVDFHESAFSAGLAAEDAFTQAKGFWFQLSDQDKQKGEGAKWQWGPQNPQALDRYSYVLNNPLRYTDPTGHVQVVEHWWGVEYIFTPEETVQIGNVLVAGGAIDVAIGAILLAAGFAFDTTGVGAVAGLILQAIAVGVGAVGASAVAIGAVLQWLGCQ